MRTDVFYGKYIEPKEGFALNKFEDLNFLDFLLEKNPTNIRQQISHAVDLDMKMCVLEEQQQRSNNDPFETLNNRILFNHNILPNKKKSFTFLLFEKLKSIFIMLGVVDEFFSELTSSNGKIGLDIMVDFPLAGEEELCRVSDYHDDELVLFKKHTLIFNHSMEKITIQILNDMNGKRETLHIPSMIAILIHGKMYFGRSKNFTNNLIIANFQCHLVNSLVQSNIKFNFESINNGGQYPHHILVFDDSYLNHKNPKRIDFIFSHCCENISCKSKSLNCKDDTSSWLTQEIARCCTSDSNFFPFCTECFLESMCKNMISLDFSEFNMKASQTIKEQTIIFEYSMNDYSTEYMIINDYQFRNIPLALINAFCIEVKNDFCDDGTKLLYDFSEQFCALHFIKQSEKYDDANCSVLCSIKDGKYFLQLITTRNINSGESFVRIIKSSMKTKFRIEYKYVA
jgi:hypothetical protein